jgi:hypothetical protein
LHGGRRFRWVTLACASVLALSAAPAGAATVGTIPGSPLTINADDNGQLQVTFNGSSTGEFYPSSSQSANAGFNLAQTGFIDNPNNFTVFGFRGMDFMPDTVPAVSGNGSPASPWVLTTRFRTGTPSADGSVRVDERIQYVNGSTDVQVHYDVFNDADTTNFGVQARVYEAADLYVSGNDTGVAFFDPGPPRQVGGINEAQGSSGRLVEQTSWSHYQEGNFSNVFTAISGSSLSTQGLNDTVDPTLLDNGVGVQRNFDIPGQTSVGFDVTWRFRRFTPLTLTLAAAAKQQGQIASVTVSARNSDGNPDAGRRVLYAINGANPGFGAVTTGADGNATIRWTGANQGTDQLGAFVDINNNGARDANEPEQDVTVTFGPPPPPVPGKSVVATVVSGTVLVKYPPGYTPRAAQAAASSGFVPFKGAANLPVGTHLDTKKGRVALTSSADTRGKKTQTSDFYNGIFQVKQALPKKKPKKPAALTTDIVLKGQIARSQCAPLKGARAAAVDAKKKKGPKSVLGKLWGNGKGKFRTTGKYSSATVRGTIWLTQDECDGTLTKVTRGTVSARDFRRKKTVRVRAGHSYLARAQRATSKSRKRR